jgi:hypothetical protein
MALRPLVVFCLFDWFCSMLPQSSADDDDDFWRCGFLARFLLAAQSTAAAMRDVAGGLMKQSKRFVSLSVKGRFKHFLPLQAAVVVMGVDDVVARLQRISATVRMVALLLLSFFTLCHTQSGGIIFPGRFSLVCVCV